DKAFEVGNFLSGASGAKLGLDASGQTFGEMDRLFIRIKAYFETLTTINAESLAGEQRITPGGGIKCTHVVEKGLVEVVNTRPKIDEEGEPILDSDDNPVMEEYTEMVDNGVPEGVYRCYFLSEQDGEKTETKIIPGDQAISQMFNAKTGTANKISNHRYWRLVTDVSNDAYTDDSGNRYGYIDLSKSDCEVGSDTPQSDDTIVQFGNRTDHSRQAAMVFSTVASDAPSIKLFTGIGSGTTNAQHYSLSGKDIISYGYDSVKGHAYFKCYGDNYIGSPDGKTFFKYDQATEQLDIKAKFTILPSSTIDGKSLDDYFSGLIPELKQEDIEGFVNAIVDPKFDDIQDQLDGVIESFFGFGAPTLTNYPANEWTTDEARKAHAKDTYTDRTEYVDSTTTPTAGQSWKWQYTSFTDYGWVKIADSDAVKALLDAARAQDTADGKRRIFTSQPISPYDEGDLWVNATYPAGNTVKDHANGKYFNDILRCVTAKGKDAPFALSDWTLASNYTDDTIANEAIKKIKNFDYIKDAFKEATTIQRGLVLTSMVSLGVNNDDFTTQTTYSGISGLYKPEKPGGGIAAWYGGDMIDKLEYYNWDDATGRWVPKPGVSADGLRIAAGLDRMDGTGYRADGNFWWGLDGKLHADPLSFFVGENSVGNVLGLFKFNPNNTAVFADVKSVTPQRPFTSLWLGSPDGAHMIELTYDTTHNALRVKGNMYADGWLSFRGANDGSGGSAVAGAANLSDLKDVSLGSLAAGQALVWNGAKWVNSTIATSGLDEASLANYLSSHGYATQQWANGAFVNKAGDTMTGPLAVREIDAPDGNGLLAYAGSWSGVDFSSQYGVGTINRQGVIRSGNASLVHYRHGAGNATIWDSLNDGSGSGLDADLLDGVHNGDVTAKLVNYNNDGNVSGAVQFMQKYSGWNAWDAPTQNWYSVIKLNHGNGDTYYSRVLAFDFHSDNIYTHRKHNGTDYGWHTLAFIDSTVANANSLGGIAAGDYVTRNGDQKIGGVKTFTTYVKNEMASMFKAGSDGIYFAPSTDGSLRINTHTNYSYTGYIGRISQDGSLTMGSFIKSGGTASQFLKADGSVDGTSYATASALSTGLAGKVSKSGDTMSGDLWFGAPDKGVKFNHAGINGIWGHTRDNAATNQIGSTALSNLVIASHWGVAFTSTCSNQTYTDKVAVGIDTRIGSVAAGSWVKASHFLANTTRLCTNLNADLLDSYHVSQLARLTSANASAGAHNLPVYVNGGVVNAVSSVGEAFLSWGGRSLSGGFSPVDGAMVGALGANRFAFIKPAGTTFQYSTNSGSTWNNYNLSDTQKSGFFDAGVQQALYASGASNVVGTASHQLRIIIATSAACIYTAINKFVINFSTQGCHGTTVTIEKALESTPDNWVTVASNVPLSGWSGWNVVNVPAFLTYGNSPGVQYGRIRFTFKCTSVGSNNSPFAVYCIMAYGGFGWITASSMAANGHLYSYDGNQNAYFPGCVRLNNDGQYPGTTWNNGAGQLGIALVNNSNQTPLLVAHRYGAASDVTGTNRLFALELLNSGAEMHFAFGGLTKFSMTNTGVFFANGGLWTNGFLSFKGKNTSSDARLKRYIGDIRVPLAVIAKAPNIIYAWRDDGSLDMGSIAQYWQRYLPLSVRLCQNGYLGMDYSKVALACVISMASELLGVKDDVSVLKQEVRQLKRENQQLKQQIDKMERRIA
ncbi:cell division protein ZapB, partial [uncultured Muribaculum sp.]|uniref:cell division protein ZapB n=1 Tax=uncultured Muribaculum sp. TaxID=1918613 RepID=UPI0034A11713